MNRPIAIPLYILVFLFISIAGAHAHGGKPIEEDTCTRRLDRSLIHFSLYQPQVNDETEYCSDIPATGSAFLVIDLVDFDLRTTPMSLQILETTDDSGEKVLLDLAPQVYPRGVIQTRPYFAKAGTYVAVVKRGDDDHIHSQFQVRVGQGEASFLKQNPIFILIIGLAVLALFGPVKSLLQRKAG